MVAKVVNLDVPTFNDLVIKCRNNGVKYNINKVRQHIISVDLFNPNILNVEKWLEIRGFSPFFSLKFPKDGTIN